MYILTATNIQNDVYCNIGKLLSKETLKSLERTIKEGSLTYYVTTAIVQGEARVGKTCLKSLILSLPYDKVSTSCIEAPCIAYGNFSVEHYASSDSINWKLVNEDEMDKKIIAEIQERAKEHTASTKRENPHKNEAIPNEESDKDSITDFDLLTVTPESEDELNMVSSNDVTKSIPENMLSRVMSQKELENNDQDHNDDYQNKMVDAAIMKQTATLKSSIFEDCLKKHSIPRFGSHKRWLYFIDSGGQIQFQKLLLAFMPFTSVLFLVVKLSKNLSDSSCQLIQLPNEIVGVDEHGMKVEEVLKQVLSAVASNTQRYHQSLVNDYIKHPIGRLQVITVGTYHDEYNELIKSNKIESIEEKEMKLFNIIDSVSSICDTSHILHKLDGRKATRGDFKDKVVETIDQSLHDKAYEVKVPLKWHYFGVLLRKEAKDSNGVLAKSSCEEYGGLLDMSVEDVNSALDFFHTLKMLFYYPDSQAKDIVFVKLDSLINIIRELVIQFRCDEKRLPKQQRPQVAKGYLPISLIEETKAFKKIENIPNLSTKLLDLFKHLKIAAQLDEDENKDTLVMPALLPIKDLSDDKALSITAQPPLLFYFNNAVPMGLFCAVMVHLLANKKKEWRITYEDHNFSNYFTLEKDIIETGRSLTVVIIEKFNCIEIHCTSGRHLIKGDIYKAINEVTKHTHIDYKTPEAAFYCPCNGKRDHVARVKKNVFLICDNTGKNQNNIISDDEQEQYWSWFMDKQEIEVMKSERREDFCNNERKQQSTCKCIHNNNNSYYYYY